MLAALASTPPADDGVVAGRLDPPWGDDPAALGSLPGTAAAFC